MRLCVVIGVLKVGIIRLFCGVIDDIDRDWFLINWWFCVNERDFYLYLIIIGDNVYYVGFRLIEFIC